MTETELHAARLLMSQHAAFEWLDNSRPCPPRDVKPRHAVPRRARAGGPAFGPTNGGEPAHPLRVQPRTLFSGGKIYVRLRPPPRPVVFGTIEASGVHPIAQCELVRVTDAEAPLLGRVDEKKPAQRPERLPAKALLALLLDEQHSAARVGRLRGGDKTRESRSNDDYVSVVHSHGRFQGAEVMETACDMEYLPRFMGSRTSARIFQRGAGAE